MTDDTYYPLVSLVTYLTASLFHFNIEVAVLILIIPFMMQDIILKPSDELTITNTCIAMLIGFSYYLMTALLINPLPLL